MAQQVFDGLAAHLDLPVAEQFLQHRSDQFVIGPADLHRRRRAQPRHQIGQPAAPVAGRQPRRRQHMAARLGHAVEGVEEDRVVGRPVDPLDRQRRAGDSVEIDAAGGDRPRAGEAAPDMGKMGLAASLGAGEHGQRARPTGPRLDPGQRCAVAIGDQEVVPPVSRPLV